MPKIQRVLISVTDKTGIVDFARQLSELSIEIVSTGGTAKLLRESGVPVRDVAEVTGFPEMLDGRVKTMHPNITGGILAIRSNPVHMQALAAHGIAPIDMVVVNLYQFEKAAAKAGAPLSELIDNIDIGGPAMIRSAAKNYQDVAVVVSPGSYAAILDELLGNDRSISAETCWKLAQKAFQTTADYDRAISARLGTQSDAPALPAILDVRAPKRMDLRYGENPHQSAALYASSPAGVAGGEQLHGKELSYNNLVDLDAAWLLVNEFDRPAAAIVKHTNPCGCAELGSLAECYRKALECDPVSAFGGVIGFNRQVDRETAGEVVKTFIEAIAAPDFSPAAMAIFSAKKNLRLVKVTPAPESLVIKSISGGYLAQTEDTHKLAPRSVHVEQVKTRRAPTENEWGALEFAWKIVKHVKSNAIVYARAGQTVGIGAGQMSRVDSARLGGQKAVLPLQGTVIGSDAFFPFPDGLEE
ncbi:MAG: bifunctional phosphoribosylaminoimidazolecarboxamide formyltransferase/IMP cyclohydrolase, partial [Acidobacteriota bacterium]|nr:bifunctional phosphoribosylaminoimidazolecarboxamide formyltransferase/IMP cyclohydrolase [Acidobacteriota bacterium]